MSFQGAERYALITPDHQGESQDAKTRTKVYNPVGVYNDQQGALVRGNSVLSLVGFDVSFDFILCWVGKSMILFYLIELLM